jgi:hypothetical protein
MKSKIDQTFDKLKQISKLERLTSSNKKPLKVYQGESIWPYIQMGISSSDTKYDIYSLRSELEFLEGEYTNLKENLIPEKLTKFSQLSEYSLFDPESREYLVHYNMGPESVETLLTLQEKGYVKLTGGTRKQAKEWNSILNKAILNMQGDTKLITQTPGINTINILKPFAVKRNDIPKMVMAPAAEFRKIRRHSPDDYNKLLTFIKEL